MPVEIFKDKSGEWRFRVRAKNKKIIAASEGYKRRGSAVNGVVSLKKNMEDISFCELSEIKVVSE